MDKKEQLLEAVAKSDGGDREKMTCAEAFALAEKYEASITEIGRICNENNVKICKCQLGCFK
jgi:hypothetical protein